MHDLIKAYRFEGPSAIPIKMSVELTCWDYYDNKELLAVIKKHPYIFPDYEAIERDSKDKNYPPWKRKGIPYTDSWGCEWLAEIDGWTGIVQKPSMDSWDKLEGFIPPSYETQNGWGVQDWGAFEKNIKATKAKGLPVSAGLRHGHCFLTLSYMRGFENLMFDMADEDENLDKLLAMIEKFDLDFVNKVLSYDEVDIVHYPEDLGSQTNSMVSPQHFKRYIKPLYTNVMRPTKEKGKLVHMHSDGYILNLMDDIIDCGVDIINLQDLVNGIDNIKKELKGRIAIDLDIDRQSVVPMGTPKDIDDLIKEAVTKLWAPEGGLSLLHALEPPTPIENIDALFTALTKYSQYKG